MTQIKTNLNINDMANELRQHFKGCTNKDYIKRVIEEHYNKWMIITFAEYKQLRQEYNV